MKELNLSSLFYCFYPTPFIHICWLAILSFIMTYLSIYVIRCNNSNSKTTRWIFLVFSTTPQKSFLFSIAAEDIMTMFPNDQARYRDKTRSKWQNSKGKSKRGTKSLFAIRFTPSPESSNRSTILSVAKKRIRPRISKWNSTIATKLINSKRKTKTYFSTVRTKQIQNTPINSNKILQKYSIALKSVKINSKPMKARVKEKTKRLSKRWKF